MNTMRNTVSSAAMLLLVLVLVVTDASAADSRDNLPNFLLQLIELVFRWFSGADGENDGTIRIPLQRGSVDPDAIEKWGYNKYGTMSPPTVPLQDFMNAQCR